MYQEHQSEPLAGITLKKIAWSPPSKTRYHLIDLISTNRRLIKHIQHVFKPGIFDAFSPCRDTFQKQVVLQQSGLISVLILQNWQWPLQKNNNKRVWDGECW